METITLGWRGPLGLGNLPMTKQAIDDLRVPAVYVFFRCYEGFKGKTLVYVGKTENFSKRLAMHYTDFIGCNSTLYNDDGTPFRSGWPYEYFRSIQENLDETLRHAVADAKRTKFIYAPFADKTRLAIVEATVIWRLRGLPAENFTNWNTTCKKDLVAHFSLEHASRDLRIDRLAPEELDRMHMILSACAVEP